MVQGTTAPGAIVGARPQVTAIVPGWNEERTVGDVIRELKQSPLLDEVIYVDNASKDSSAARAADEGARIVHMPVPGKGQAMAAGVASTDSPFIMFVDADLTGFRQHHVDQLVEPVLDGRTQMTRGLFDKGGTSWIGERFGRDVADQYTFARARVLPVLTGERVIPRELFEALKESEARGWAIETSLNRLARQRGIEPIDTILVGMSHLEKSEKYPTGKLAGTLSNVKALTETQLSKAGFAVRRMTGGLDAELGAVDVARRVLASQGDVTADVIRAARLVMPG